MLQLPALAGQFSVFLIVLGIAGLREKVFAFLASELGYFLGLLCSKAIELLLNGKNSDLPDQRFVEIGAFIQRLGEIP